MPNKRRLILDAAVRVFARRGFHACRVADIADEAGVAYGLVYHYFVSKDEILDTLFVERWTLLLDVIRDVRDGDLAPRDKLLQIASFVFDSYRHDPDLMKVILVEVTRAASTFGQTHVDSMRSAHQLIAEIVSGGQAEGSFRPELPAPLAAMVFYGAIEQVITGWTFHLSPDDQASIELAKAVVVDVVCGGLQTTAAAAEMSTVQLAHGPA